MNQINNFSIQQVCFTGQISHILKQINKSNTRNNKKETKNKSGMVKKKVLRTLQYKEFLHKVKQN